MRFVSKQVNPSLAFKGLVTEHRTVKWSFLFQSLKFGWKDEDTAGENKGRKPSNSKKFIGIILEYMKRQQFFKSGYVIQGSILSNNCKDAYKRSKISFTRHTTNSPAPTLVST